MELIDIEKLRRKNNWQELIWAINFKFACRLTLIAGIVSPASQLFSAPSPKFNEWMKITSDYLKVPLGCCFWKPPLASECIKNEAANLNMQYSATIFTIHSRDFLQNMILLFHEINDNPVQSKQWDESIFLRYIRLENIKRS